MTAVTINAIKILSNFKSLVKVCWNLIWPGLWNFGGIWKGFAEKLKFYQNFWLFTGGVKNGKCPKCDWSFGKFRALD